MNRFSVEFSRVPVGASFSLNGNYCEKVSTRTAVVSYYITPDETADKTEYFGQREIVTVNDHVAEAIMQSESDILERASRWLTCDGATQYDELAGDRAFILDAMGVTCDATFVPWSESRNADNKNPSLNWRVTLRYQGKDVLTTDYTQGLAHCPAYKDPPRFPDGSLDWYMRKERIKLECETGRKSACMPMVDSATATKNPIDPPDVQDVMHSLLLDAEAIDAYDFEDWCGEFGYDSDSISAREAYDACVQTGLKLRNAFGDKTLSELRELFEDM